jgi:quercetin dioxygenase-like cupin family protein
VSYRVARYSIAGKCGFVVLSCFYALAGAQTVETHAGEREGTATVIHRAVVMEDRGTNHTSQKHLWPLYSTPEARMNYFEVTARTGLHFHPDADHRLYVLEGKVVVTAGTNTSTAAPGDLIVIPRGVRHCYDVPAKGERALLLTFDAPPYDPNKTVNLEPPPGKNSK